MKVTWKNRIAIVAVLLLVTTNPLVAVHINDAVNWVFNQIIENSGYVGMVCLAYLVGLFVWNDRRHNSLKIPKATSKDKKLGLKYEAAK